MEVAETEDCRYNDTMIISTFAINRSELGRNLRQTDRERYQCSKFLIARHAEHPYHRSCHAEDRYFDEKADRFECSPSDELDILSAQSDRAKLGISPTMSEHCAAVIDAHGFGMLQRTVTARIAAIVHKAVKTSNPRQMYWC